ncbi:hypothetical protein ACHAXA_011101 [Cyclostephanos tholiformis]|uniref:Uncharacterized protein n=1 Tax=Cyclostephanos tholiformis TaxID=382380 RepID=A0ABD3SFR2_9STRA
MTIGAPGYLDTKVSPGYARVYDLVRDDDLGFFWKQRGQDLTGEAIGVMFGNSVSISDDGKVLAVSSRMPGRYTVQVHIYHWEDNGVARWKPLGDIIDGENGTNLGDSVSLSWNGSIVAIGSPYGYVNGTYFGYVKVYQLDGGITWKPMGETLHGDAVKARFGSIVDITPDGKTLAISSKETVRVYQLVSSGDLDQSWKQFGEDILCKENCNDFASSFSLSDDGKNLAVAYRNDDKLGHVIFYQMDASSESWRPQILDIDGDATGDYPEWGSVSLSADGMAVAIGAYENDKNGISSGSVRIFAVMI